MTGTIPGGTRLVQSCIADELAVSTRPVRDALRELAAEGFVRLDGRGAAVVRELGRGELEDIYEIRMMLEPVAAARAARLATAASLIRAGELLTVMQAAADEAQWVEHNAGFYKIIDEAGSSPRLVAILGNSASCPPATSRTQYAPCPAGPAGPTPSTRRYCGPSSRVTRRRPRTRPSGISTARLPR